MNCSFLIAKLVPQKFMVEGDVVISIMQKGFLRQQNAALKLKQFAKTEVSYSDHLLCAQASN